jgi:hypothetical protein
MTGIHSPWLSIYSDTHRPVKAGYAASTECSFEQDDKAQDKMNM